MVPSSTTFARTARNHKKYVCIYVNHWGDWVSAQHTRKEYNWNHLLPIDVEVGEVSLVGNVPHRHRVRALLFDAIIMYTQQQYYRNTPAHAHKARKETSGRMVVVVQQAASLKIIDTIHGAGRSTFISQDRIIRGRRRPAQQSNSKSAYENGIEKLCTHPPCPCAHEFQCPYTHKLHSMRMLISGNSGKL